MPERVTKGSEEGRAIVLCNVRTVVQQVEERRRHQVHHHTKMDIKVGGDAYHGDEVGMVDALHQVHLLQELHLYHTRALHTPQ